MILIKNKTWSNQAADILMNVLFALFKIIYTLSSHRWYV